MSYKIKNVDFSCNWALKFHLIRTTILNRDMIPLEKMSFLMTGQTVRNNTEHS